MIKFDRQEECIDFEELKVKEKQGYIPMNINNVFVTEELILSPLYKKMEFNPDEKNFNFFPYSDVRVECYCNKCKCRRIFCFENSNLARYNIGPGSQPLVKNILAFNKVFTLKAKADCSHIMFMNILVVDDRHIMKIGQFPSIYDMNEGINNRQFLKLLDEEYVSYYKSACSLYSYNTCIGAMVYLRRIFEKVLDDTFKENEDKLTISYVEFKKERMENKIVILKEYLPQVLFEQGFNSIYIKISDGVHNLEEQECFEIFPVLKDAIEEILIDKLEIQEKEKRRKQLSTKLNNL